MSYVIKALVGFLSAVVGSMGMGGGGVLLLYLSAFTKIPQRKAQGINLIFFVPIAIVSVISHIKNKLVDKKTALIMILSSVPFAVIGAILSGYINEYYLRKALAVFLFALGVREIILSFSKKENAQSK